MGRKAFSSRDFQFASSSANGRPSGLNFRRSRGLILLRPAQLDGLCTAEGTPLPENTRAELRRDMMRLRMVREQIKEIEQERLRKLTAAPAEQGPPTMVLSIARIIGIGIETADMLVSEILSRGLRDSKAVARYAGLTGAPDESGRRRREQRLAKAGNARVRRGMIQLAWRLLIFQKDSALWHNGIGRGRPTLAAPRARG